MAYTVPELLKVLLVSGLNDGDVLIYNLGALGGNHLNDVKVVRPVFVDGDIVAFAISPRIGPISWAHGRAAISPRPSTPFRRRWIPTGSDCDGGRRKYADHAAQGCAGSGSVRGRSAWTDSGTKAGERRIVELCRQHGKDVFTVALARLHDLSEIEMREAIRELPDGVYEGEDYLDDGAARGEPARIHVKITIAGDEATFDLSDSADRASISATPRRSLRVPRWHIRRAS